MKVGLARRKGDSGSQNEAEREESRVEEAESGEFSRRKNG